MGSMNCGNLLLLGVLCPVFIGISYCFYNVFLHPLRKYPGPKIAAASHLWHLYYLNKGTLYLETVKLHEKYGLVVRVSPNELSYIDGQAWGDIYGGRVKPEMLKDSYAYSETTAIGSGIVALPTDDHRIVRRTLGHGFSEKALREQEHLIMHYLQLFIQGLYGHAGENKGPVDMTSWYNFFTFDVIGDLAFGEPFGCLESGSYHYWISMIFSQMKFLAWQRGIRVYSCGGLLDKVFKFLLPPKVAREAAAHHALTVEKTERRMQRQDERVDFLEKLIRSDKLPARLSLPAMASELIMAGSETTATWLSGTTYYLLKNPLVMEKVADEVRTAFEKGEDITVLSTAHLKYLNAVLEESLRIYPPAPVALPRRVPSAGANIAGQWVPGGTTVGIPHYTAYRSSYNFTRPTEFIPERWLGDKEFENDKKDIFQPFNFGPRNCVGKNLAYAEGRLVLASVLWHFDLKLDPASENWTDQLVFMVWGKEALKVHLTPRFSV